MHYTCPIIFLERYQRIFGLDQEEDDEECGVVGELARTLIRCMVSHSTYLRFKSSQIAACALILSINICQSDVATKIGCPKKLSNLYARSFFYEASLDQVTKGVKACPLRHWNAGVRRLTFKCVGKDLTPCYKAMVNLVDKAEFDGKLSVDSSLFLPA